MSVMIIFGPPGSGKGTQADLLVKNLGLIHISTGNLLREAIAQKTELGLQVEAILNAGRLAPDELIILPILLKFWGIRKLQESF